MITDRQRRFAGEEFWLVAERPDRTGGSMPTEEVERLRATVTRLTEELAQAKTDAAQAQERADRAEEAAAAAPGQAGPPATAAAAQAQVRRKLGWRGPVSILLVVLGCVLAPISVLAVWSANQVSNTDRYVANVAPLIREPAVQGALTDTISTAIIDQIDVQGITKQAARQLTSRGLTRLGALVSNFSGSIASGVNGLIHNAVSEIISRPFVERIWVQGNRVAHTQLVRALSGQSSSLTISNGKVVLGLGPFIDRVKHRLAAQGLTIVNSLPPINPTFPLFSAKNLVQARTLYRLLTTLKWVLPILSLVLLGLGIYVARRHRRALIGAGLGLAASMLVLGAGLAIGRAIYLNQIPPSVLPADAAAVVFDTIVRFIRQGLRVLLVLGLIVAIAGFFTGPSVTAVRTRSAFKKAFGYIRGGGEKAGVSTGPVGEWIYRYRQPLRIAAVAGAVLTFVFWTNPTGLTVAVIAILLLVVLGIIELLGRPPAAATTGTAAVAAAGPAPGAASGGASQPAAGTGADTVAAPADGPAPAAARAELAAAGTSAAAAGAGQATVPAGPAGQSAPPEVPPQAPSTSEGARKRPAAPAGSSSSAAGRVASPPAPAEPPADSASGNEHKST